MSTPAAASDEALAFRLSDIQLDEIMRLCQPLAPQCRDALLRILAYQLRGRRDVGDGGKFRPEHELLCGFDARQHAGDIASAAGRTVSTAAATTSVSSTGPTSSFNLPEITRAVSRRSSIN